MSNCRRVIDAACAHLHGDGIKSGTFVFGHNSEELNNEFDLNYLARSVGVDSRGDVRGRLDRILHDGTAL